MFLYCIDSTMSSSSIEVMSGESSVVQNKRKAEDVEYDEAAPKDTGSQSTGTSKSSLYSPQDGRTMVGPSKRAKNEHLVVKVSENTDFNAITVPVACEFCYEICADGKSLYEHMSVHENVEIRVFQCTYCSKEFYNLTELQNHMQEHEQSDKFECGVCNQTFSRKDSLGVHLRLHDKSKCVYCTVCSKPFLTPGSLQMHMRIHRGERPFECHLCGSSFTQKSHLMSHYQSHQNVEKNQRSRHLGPKVFKCTRCVKSFIRLTDFEKHLQWVHSIGTTDKQFSTENGSARLKQTIPMINNLRLKYPSNNVSKTLCDAGTQTDDSPGHVIIPKKYQQEAENNTFPDQFDEMFDEGMDRNISSDEEDSNMPTMTYTAPIPSITASTSKDDKFDAVLGIDPNKESVPEAPKNGETVAPKFPDVEKAPEQPISEVKPPPILQPSEEELKELEKEVLIDLPDEDKTGRPPSPRRGHRSMSATFNANWQRKDKPTKIPKKLKVPSVLGLTGPAHLRLIRKSLQKFISEKAAKVDSQETDETTVSDTAESPLPKRASKVKQHPEDFICTSKSCSTCSPGTVNAPAPTPTPKLDPVETAAPSKPQEKKIGESDDQSEKLLQFLLVGNAQSLEGTEYSVPPRDSRPSHVVDASLPDQLTTFSCKFCHEEFRFEGKLHRHLSLVHQTRPLLSDKLIGVPGPPRTVKRIDVNPEVAALRSEWDDENEETPPTQERASIENKLDKMRARYRYTQQNIVPRKSGQMKPVYQFTTKRRPPQKPLVSSTLATSTKPSTATHVPENKPPLETKCQKLLEKLFDAKLLMKCGFVDEHVSVVLGKILQHYGVKRIEDYGQGQYEVLKYNLWRLIEWKVTMEQMEEFYVDGSSVEEMMEDIMFGRVPIISHTEPDQQPDKSPKKEPAPGTSQMPQNQLVEVADFLGGEISIGDGVTQVMLTQDMVSPEMLQGAQIVTLDASTGQVLSQVSADQMILTGEISQALGHPIQTVSEPVVARSVTDTEVVSTLPSSSIIISDEASVSVVEAQSSDSQQGSHSAASSPKNEPS